MKQGCLINGKNVRHVWTTEDRAILALLYKLYDNSDAQRLAIFKQLNKEKLVSEGFSATGYSHNAMSKQRYDLERGGVGSDVWRKVKSMSASQARQSFAAHINSIEEAASDLRIRLRLRAGSPARAFIQAKKPTAMKATTVKVAASKPAQCLAVAQADDWEQSSSDDDDQKSPCPSRKKTFDVELIRSFAYDFNNTAAENGVPGQAKDRSVEDFTERTGRPTERPLLRLKDSNKLSLPALLFRACLPAHGFRARKFLLNHNKVPPPPPFASETFGEMVDPHLRQYRGEHADYMSPFISLAENPVRALKRISESQLPLSLAIFYTPEITVDALARYGKPCMPTPYLVPTIVSTHELERLPGGYNGRGEVSHCPLFLLAADDNVQWLVWGSIECHPLAVFEKSKALGLFSMMARIKKIDEYSGRVVGRVSPSPGVAACTDFCHSIWLLLPTSTRSLWLTNSFEHFKSLTSRSVLLVKAVPTMIS